MGQGGEVWDVESGAELRKFEGHTNWVTSVSFSGDGKQVVSGSEDNTVRVWDVESGAELRKFEGHTKSHVRVVFGRRQAGGEWVMGRDGEGVGRGERRGAEKVRGAHSLCHVRVVFGRRQAGGEWVTGQDGEGVGRGERGAEKVRGAHTLMSRPCRFRATASRW